MAMQQETAPALPVQALPHESANSQDYDDADEFQDAEEDQPSSSMSLETAFQDCEVAIRNFFNNDLMEAMNLMKPWDKTSVYHSLGTSIFEFIPAVLTFEDNQINQALASLKECLRICNLHRRNYTLVESIGTLLRKPANYAYTDLQAHAELCHAEALLLQALMIIMEGEDFAGLIKGTLKIKNCFNTYKECAKILEKKQWETEASRIHFHSGVRLGTAAFNVMISLLPPKIISVLEFIGFSGDKSLGLSELEAGSRSPGLRSVLCDLTLLGYHLVICQFTGTVGDLKTCEEILNRKLQTYPDGVWFLVFKGRFEMLHGQLRQSMATYNEAILSQDMWPAFHHLCYWEIMWINCMMLEWREAAEYANRLIEESPWSRTIYTYIKAASLLQLGDQLALEQKQQCVDLMRNASYYKQRIAGKSLPMEKFMIRRCARFEAQGGQLVLPAVELLCLWNLFPILAKCERGAQTILKLIETTRKRVDSGPQEWMAGYQADNRALLRYLHGCCLAAMGLPRMALDIFETVFTLKSEIKEDTYLLPYSLAEMAMCAYHLGDQQRAIQMLQDTRKKYSGYSLESRLHFRLHSKMEIIKSKSDHLKRSSSDKS